MDRLAPHVQRGLFGVCNSYTGSRAQRPDMLLYIRARICRISRLIGGALERMSSCTKILKLTTRGRANGNSLDYRLSPWPSDSHACVWLHSARLKAAFWVDNIMRPQRDRIALSCDRRVQRRRNPLLRPCLRLSDGVQSSRPVQSKLDDMRPVIAWLWVAARQGWPVHPSRRSPVARSAEILMKPSSTHHCCSPRPD